MTIGSALLAVQERPIACAFAVLDATLTVDLGEPDDADAQDDDDDSTRPSCLRELRGHRAREHGMVGARPQRSGCEPRKDTTRSYAWPIACCDRGWRRRMPRLARCADVMLGREVPDAIAELAGDPMLQLAAVRSPNLGHSPAIRGVWESVRDAAPGPLELSRLVPGELQPSEVRPACREPARRLARPCAQIDARIGHQAHQPSRPGRRLV